MSTENTFRPTLVVSGLFAILFIIFLAVLLMSIYGLFTVILDEIQMAQQLSLSFSDTMLSVGIVVLIGGIVIGSLFLVLLLISTMVTSIHVREDAFRITSFFYKSEWLDWNRVVKIRSVGIGEGNHIVLIGIDGLGWRFKLNGLLFWMFPYGAINLAENSLQNGRELLKIFKHKRPDLFYS